MKSEAVKTLQSNLNTLTYIGLTTDGNFGDATERAVSYYQQAKGITVDGIAGAVTQQKIKIDIANGTKVAIPWGKINEEEIRIAWGYGKAK